MTLVDSETQSHTSTAMDDDEQIKTERRQDSVNMAWNPTAARQAHRLSTPSDYVSRRVRVWAKDLGMVLDNPLSMESQVTAVCRSCFYQLRQVTTDVPQSLV